MTDKKVIKVAEGPYRATLLWTGLVRAFRNDIQLSRHRRYMKTYDDCFVASDAVEWVHQYLQKNPNFGTDVTRAQAIQLLQKLHKARVFEDVRGSKHNRGDISDNGRLFRLTYSSPSKSVCTPLVLRNNRRIGNVPEKVEPHKIEAKPLKLEFEKGSSMPSLHETSSTLPECHFVSRPMSPAEVEEQWKKYTLQSLQRVLGVESLDDVIEPQYISGKYIMHNCLHINKSGVVTNIDPKDQLPHWALSAMKCLAYWPNKTDENLPNYPGFEKDVFQVVKDYFCGLPEPLMTFNMYEFITNVFVKASEQGSPDKPDTIPRSDSNSATKDNSCDYAYSTPKNLISFKSVENLIMTLTRPSKRFTECQDASEGYSSAANILDLSPIPLIHDSSSDRRSGLGDENQFTRFETAFGPNNETVTYVHQTGGVTSEVNCLNNLNRVNRTAGMPQPVYERHSEDSPPSFGNTSAFNRQNSLRSSFQNLFGRLSSSRDRLRRAKTFSRKGSVDGNLDKENTYGCTIGVYADATNSCDTPVSRIMHEGYKKRPQPNSRRTRKTPMRAFPPSYDSLYPEPTCPNYTQPVLDKSKTKKSLSSTSLHRGSSKGKGDRALSVSEGSQVEKSHDDVVGTRSLSMSDLAVAPSPVENNLQKQCQGKLADSTDSEIGDENTERIVKALQLVCLLLPPANRRRLHLLLRLMNKMSSNEKLVLDPTQSSRTLLLETFYRAVLTSQEENEMDDLLVIQLVAFLMDRYMDIFSVPVNLKSSVEQQIAQLQRTKVKAETIVKSCKCGKIRYSDGNVGTVHYCQRVSMDEYENQRLTGSQLALATLLEEIIQNKHMALKDKKKRLKQFKKMHPEVYLHRFPCSQSETDLFPPAPKNKQFLLTKPLLKFKGLRL